MLLILYQNVDETVSGSNYFKVKYVFGIYILRDLEK